MAGPSTAERARGTARPFPFRQQLHVMTKRDYKRVGWDNEREIYSPYMYVAIVTKTVLSRADRALRWHEQRAKTCESLGGHFGDYG